jgi:hypothetical protein
MMRLPRRTSSARARPFLLIVEHRPRHVVLLA